jgi:uncharacterized coiled-coil protein SlyX
MCGACDTIRCRHDPRAVPERFSADHDASKNHVPAPKIILPVNRRSCSKCGTERPGMPVADELDYEIYREGKQFPRRRGRVRTLLLVTAVLIVMATASAYGWLNYGRLVQPASLAPSAATAAVAKDPEETVALKDFQSFQSQAAQSLQSINQEIAAQKAEVARLSDQLSALAARMDALQSTAASAPLPAAPARPASTAPRRRPAADRPAGPISVGGAPLPAAPAQDGR